MSDSPGNKGNIDATRVNIHQDHEVRYWTNKWSVTREQLEAAVRAVLDEGHAPMVDLVAAKLGK